MMIGVSVTVNVAMIGTVVVAVSWSVISRLSVRMVVIVRMIVTVHMRMPVVVGVWDPWQNLARQRRPANSQFSNCWGRHGDIAVRRPDTSCP